MKAGFLCQPHEGARGRVGVFLLLAISVFVPAARASEGVLLLGDDPVLVGRAGAGVASPATATWITLNPAAIVDLERRVDFTQSIVKYRITMRTEGIGEIPFVDEMSDDELMGLPSAGVVWPGKTGTWGLSFQVPTGACIHFPHARTSIGELEGGTDSNLEYAQPRLTLAYAHRFDSGWALGASINGSLSCGRTDYATTHVVSTLGHNEWDYAFGAGLGVGVYRDWERWSFGAALKSRQWSQVFDKYRDVTSYPVDLPMTLHTGIAYRITPEIQVECDYRFLNWNDTKFFHKTNVQYGMGWNDQHCVMFGVEWQVSPRFALRAGYSHVSHAMTDEHVFGSAIVPNVITDHVAAGCTIALTRNSDLHVSLAHWFTGRQTESGTGDVYSSVGKGTECSLQADWLTLGYSLRF